ncbi:MAG: hypothetical protein ACLFNT_13550 [Spirochaetales bacterium]
MEQLEQFLTNSPIAQRVAVDARIVMRRFQASPRELERAMNEDLLSIEGKPLYELIVGETLVARGEIITESGASRFRVTEVVE